MSELKPCPFCKVNMVRFVDSVEENCFRHPPVGCILDGNVYSDHDRYVREWNRRDGERKVRRETISVEDAVDRLEEWVKTIDSRPSAWDGWVGVGKSFDHALTPDEITEDYNRAQDGDLPPSWTGGAEGVTLPISIRKRTTEELVEHLARQFAIQAVDLDALEKRVSFLEMGGLMWQHINQENALKFSKVYPRFKEMLDRLRDEDAGE